ncbi:DNA gyrase inhibitor YacG [Roseomonas terrae]|jgi:endogenous inhibitor of DNA gyrase (YacG/DUF329 family)|uniref:DNA gyrase inhibitor YacG n=2 Tax=Neoroseomonas terrae TaxID=424799 RepID=A0ABS5EQC8_9PROT|nr:DNA gyrase inhibitor YacG [Neoroseomonas terrae]MBR0653219.1 DNA gyrase inhibitor YacG [Neoroseomonas terrae]
MPTDKVRATTPRCPICSRPAQPATRPFCSPRCAQVDLSRWLTGGYAIPSEAEGPPEKDEDA